MHGTSSAAEELTETCKALPTMTSEIYAPHLGESLRIGEDMVSYPLSLGDGLMPTLNMSKVRLPFLFVIVMCIFPLSLSCASVSLQHIDNHIPIESPTSTTSLIS